MAEKVPGWLNGLVKFPWWASVILAAGVYAALSWVVPVIIEGQSLLRPFTSLIERMAPAAALVMLLAAAVSACCQFCSGKLLRRQTGLGSEGDPSRRQFESLVSEAFRRKGFMVLHRIEDGPDRGVNIWLRKNGQVTFVQCKHWKAGTVGVGAVRELYGVMTAESVMNGVIVTCGGFTLDAMEFARASSIALIDGPRLTQLVASVQQGGNIQVQQQAGRTSPGAAARWRRRLRGKVLMQERNSGAA